MTRHPDVTFVGITAQDTDEEMVAFVERHGLDGMPTVVDDDGELWARFGVRVQPAWVLLPDDGEPVAVYGPLPGEALEERLTSSFG